MTHSGSGEVGEAKFLLTDEDWQVSDFDGSRATRQDSADILYVCTHGKTSPGTYRAILHEADWEPLVTGIGLGAGPWIAVFDTCDLIKLTDPRLATGSAWTVGPALRLLLGFASLATVDKGPSQRGKAFAANLLMGMPIASAWLEAVHSTGFPGLDLAIAIALGDDLADARTALTSASLILPPPRRRSATAVAAWKVCH